MSFQAGAMAAGAVLATLAARGEELGKYNSIMTTQRSLIGATQGARVEPLTLVESSLVHLDYITDVLQSLQSQFTGFWLQALAMVTDLNGASAIKILDPLNPNRDPNYREFANSLKRHAGLESLYLSAESYRWALPTSTQRMLPALAAEADKSGLADAIKEVKDVANLSVGKMINVKIKHGGQEMELPISIRLMVADMPTSALVSLVGDKTQNASFKSRFNDYVDGLISFGDLAFGNDLIKERKKMLAKDKDGVYTEVRRRQQEHKKAGLLTGKASLAEACNLYVISKDATDQLASNFGYDITNFSQREKIFENTSAMIIAVIDPEYERVTFYHQGLRQSSNLGVRDIKVANKNTGPNIMDIFQAYKEGAAPRY